MISRVNERIAPVGVMGGMNGVPSRLRAAGSQPLVDGQTLPDRDQLLSRRFVTASKRDVAADARDRAAEQRDRDADERDREASLDDARVTTASGPEVAARAARDRRRAAGDRERAADERLKAARDRDRAARDRAAAALYRAEALRQRELAGIDPLTGARRRDLGLDELQRAIDRAERTSGELVAAFVDVDDLKAVNDTAGHAAGDAVLVAVVEALHERLRSYDVVVRLGGDEFLCAIADVSVAQARARFAAVARQLAAAPFPCAITVGYAALVPGETAEDLIARADTELLARRRERPDAARTQAV
jgi:diguanylate cyclase (GGDEF)-like protein